MSIITLDFPQEQKEVKRENLYYDENLDLNIHIFIWNQDRPIPFKEGDIIEVTFYKEENDDSNDYNHKIIKIEDNKIFSAEYYNGQWYRYKMNKI